MARVNITVSPINGINGKPAVHQDDAGNRYCFAILSIGSGQTYATADRCVLVHAAGSDFYEHFGSRIIKNIVCDPFGSTGISTGILQLQWEFATQDAKLTVGGDGGSVAPTGPRDEAELTNGTALGAGVMTSNAVIFF